jgi:hypothetical protein
MAWGKLASSNYWLALTMDARLVKQWEVTRRLLQLAATEIASDVHQREFAHCLSHNELELALDVLEGAAAEQRVSVGFWRNMKRAAEVMGLPERRKRFQLKLQECRRGRQANR